MRQFRQRLDFQIKINLSCSDNLRKGAHFESSCWSFFLQNPQTGVLPEFVVDDVEDEEDALAEVEFDEDDGDGLALTARGATAFVAKEDAFEFEFELDYTDLKMIITKIKFVFSYL
mgnify:CR=1 FL=1